MRRRFWWRAAMAVVVAASLAPALAEQPDGYNHPEIQWRELETDHFLMVFNDGLEATARLAGGILESAHGELCEELGVQPAEKTTIVVTDYDDVGSSNFARRLEHVVYVSNPVMNQARISPRGWLTHLLRHEYTHVLNGWALRDAGRAVGPLIEWTGMELQPQWFTEGLAEYVGSGGGQDEVQYVLHAAQEGRLLYGGKLDIPDNRFNVMETALVYRQGYSMCQGLVRLYGSDIFRRLFKLYAKAPQWDIAFKLATGDTVEHFYRVWLAEVREKADQLPKQEALDGHSRVLETPLEATLGGRMSPDGKYVAVFGVPDWEQPIPGLYLMPAEGGRLRKIAGNLDLYDSWRLSWSPDSRTLAYVARVADGTGSVRDAVFLYDTESRRTHRVKTGDNRVFEAEFSPDGSQLAVTAYRGEHAMLAVMNRDGSDLQFVTHQLAADCFSPTWSPDGTRLAFSLTDDQGVDIGVIQLDGSGFERLTNDVWPDQYPTWGPGGIAFSSYRPATGSADRGDAAVAGEAEGIAGAGTNAYLMDPAGGQPREITKATTGGVFYPSWTADGKGLVFSLYKVRTAEVRVLDLSGSTAQAPAEPTATETAAAPLLDLRTAEPNTVRVASTDVAAVLATPARPPSAKPVATDTTAATERRPGSAPETAPVRDYNGFARVRPYVTRPFTDTDGLGDTIGVRTRMTDPLHQHEVSAEASFGLGSDKLGWQVQYHNDQTAWRTGINFFRRVPPVRAERGVLVADTSIGTEALAELPLSFGNPYAKDRFKLGLEYADHRPFSTAGGVLVPAPVHAVVCGPSIGWERNQIFPGTGSQHLEAKLTQSLKPLGAQLTFTTGTVNWSGSFFAPNPRAVLGAAANLYYFEGLSFSRTNSQQLAAAGELRYDWRVGDQFLSRYTWPYLHVGPTYLSASYQLRSLLKGTGSGLDLRDSAEVGLTNRGFVSRQAEYQLQLVQRWFLGGGNKSEFLALLKFQWRDLPF